MGSSGINGRILKIRIQKKNKLGRIRAIFF